MTANVRLETGKNVYSMARQLTKDLDDVDMLDQQDGIGGNDGNNGKTSAHEDREIRFKVASEHVDENGKDIIHSEDILDFTSKHTAYTPFFKVTVGTGVSISQRYCGAFCRIALAMMCAI